jgi:hypothetical protein
LSSIDSRLDQDQGRLLIARAQQVVGVGGMEVPLERDFSGGRFLQFARVAMAGVDPTRDGRRASAVENDFS